MKIYISLALLISNFCDCDAKLGKEWLINTSEMAERTGENPTKTNVIELGGELVGIDHYNSGTVDETKVIQQITSTLLAIPGHARFFADEIKREQKEVASVPTVSGPRVSYDRHRSWHFETLCHLPSPETIAVLGEFLSDEIDTPHPLMSPGSDWGENPRANSFYSAGTIMMIGLRNPPVAVARRNDEPEIRLAETRVWWERIRSGELAFSFIGQTVEYRFKPDGTWDTTPLPASILEQDPKPVASAPVVSDKPVASNIESTKPRWPWILGGIAALLAGVFWLRLKASTTREDD